MQFSSFSEFVAMGGYGFYVWLSYGVSFLLLLGLVMVTKTQHSKIKRTIAQSILRNERINKARKELSHES
ncbi:heme exporter protein CcmD [Flocculibacter collagenilyticus]|uniref:heme exporter protein CcmD n=1 Tax=Flocculibacter collagenilyticus TaxID=2744479 RepID=UPI0018F511F2|nr:heme exporter protein CcmD [Flocculibacter collagenilyticus]